MAIVASADPAVSGAVVAHGAALDGQCAVAIVHPAAEAAEAAGAVAAIAVPAVPGAVAAHGAAFDGQVAEVVHPAAVAAVTAVAVVAVTGSAIPGAVVAHGAAFDGQVAAVVHPTAVVTIAAAITAIGGLAVGEFDTLDLPGGPAMHMQHPVELGGIDNRSVGPGAGESDGALKIQVAGGVVVFARAGDDQGVSAGRKVDHIVVAAVGIGLADGPTQAAIVGGSAVANLVGGGVGVGGGVHIHRNRSSIDYRNQARSQGKKQHDQRHQ